MSALLPKGFVSLREAVAIFEEVLFAGIPNNPVVTRHWQDLDADIGDGSAQKCAAAALWAAVDRGDIYPWAIGGIPPKQLRLTREMTNGLPMLRGTGGFGFLRPSAAAHKDIAGWFGPHLSNIHLTFRSNEVRESAKRALRARRSTTKRSTVRPRGRRSLYNGIAPIIEQLIDSKKWDTLQSIKRLTQLVNRSNAVQTILSEDTITRFLERLHEESGDRKFTRLERRRRPNKKRLK